MKATWQVWARRIDALSLRERAILFASLALVLVALVDTLVLSPRAAEQKALVTRLRTQAADLASLRQRAGPDPAADRSPAARLQRELQTLRGERQAVDAEIERRLAGGASSPRLAALLENVLRRHERLVLRKLATGTPVTTLPGAPPLQGVELALRGSYADLAQYVADLERSLPGLRWDELVIARRDAAAELRARLALPGEPK